MIALRQDLSLSKAPLIRSGCGWWMLLAALWRDDANEYTRGGTEVHRPLAALAVGGVLELPGKPELRAMYGHGRAWLLEEGFIGVKKGSPPRAELALAYDVATDTARELEDPPGEEGTRWYVDPAKRAAYDGPGGPIRPTEIPTRLDFAVMRCDGEGWFVELVDYKCHFGPEYASAVAQLELVALAVARAWNLDRVRARALHLWANVEPEVEEAGELAPSGMRELDAGALNAIATELALDLEVDGDAQPNAGPWCAEHHCPARASCPETLRRVESAIALIPEERLSRKYSMTEPATTNDHGAFKLVGIPLIKAWLEAQKEEVDALADTLDGIRLKDGSVYSGKTHIEENPNLEVPGAVEVLEDLGFDLAVDTTPKTTWTAIKTLGGQPGQDAAKDALRKLGAVKASPVTVYRSRGPEKAGAKALRAKKQSPTPASEPQSPGEGRT